MFALDLNWLTFPVNLDTVETWLKANAGENYKGNSADADLTLWFSEEPSDDIKLEIMAYWEALTSDSIEATGYKTAAQIKADLESAKNASLASATSKLEQLGLSADEIAAIVGK